jgi:hypothetical protein
MPHAQTCLANNTCWAAFEAVQKTQITPCIFEFIQNTLALVARWRLEYDRNF